MIKNTDISKVFYTGDIPAWSPLYGKKVSSLDAIVDIYKELEKIRRQINLDEYDGDCLDYSGRTPTVSNVIEAQGDVICKGGGGSHIIRYSKSVDACATKNNCNAQLGSVGFTGSEICYNFKEGLSASANSQAEATQRAQTRINNLIQKIANLLGTCGLTVYKNIELSISLERNDCEHGNTGLLYAYTVPSGKYTSIVSQVDADNKAKEDISANAQKQANINLPCKKMYYSQLTTGSFEKTCSEGMKSEPVVFTIPYGQFESTVSQVYVDMLAQREFDEKGPAYAEANGECKVVYWNDAMSGYYSVDNCPRGYKGYSHFVSIGAGLYHSFISQADANETAKYYLDIKGKEYAYEQSVCVEVLWNVDGSVSPSYGGDIDGTGVYRDGDICRISVDLEQGYEIKSVALNGEKINYSYPYFEFEVNSDTFVNITLTNNTKYNVSVSVNDPLKGSIIGGGEFVINTKCTLIATPVSGSIFKGWYVGGELVKSTRAYSFTVMSDVSLIAMFE